MFDGREQEGKRYRFRQEVRTTDGTVYPEGTEVIVILWTEGISWVKQAGRKRPDEIVVATVLLDPVEEGN